jgi:D-alanyl-D-alanine carboxypeptidase
MKAMPVLVPMTEPTQPAAVAPSAPVQVQVQTRQGDEVSRTMVAAAEPTPAAAPAPVVATIAAPAPAPQKTERAPVETARAELAKTADNNPTPRAQPRAHNGWVIQIGAYGGEDEARQHLNLAQSKLQKFTGVDPFTERVQKGDTTLYRARFAGFDRTTAEAACRQLKRSDFACMALKD